MKISKEKTAKIASLARLGLGAKEIDKFSKDLSKILDYIDKLQQVDTEKVEATSQVTGLENVKRADSVLESNNQKEILDNAPASRNNFIKVKAVFE